MTEPPGRTKFLTDEQLASLLKAAEPNPAMHAAMLLSVATGIRQGELLSLTWKNIDLDGGKISLLKTKNKTPRTMHVPATAVAALRGLKKAKIVSTTHIFLIATGVPWKMSTLEQRWSKIRKAAGIDDFHRHDLCHNCASFLARRGTSMREIG